VNGKISRYRREVRATRPLGDMPGDPRPGPSDAAWCRRPQARAGRKKRRSTARAGKANATDEPQPRDPQATFARPKPISPLSVAAMAAGRSAPGASTASASIARNPRRARGPALQIETPDIVSGERPNRMPKPGACSALRRPLAVRHARSFHPRRASSTRPFPGKAKARLNQEQSTATLGREKGRWNHQDTKGSKGGASGAKAAG